MAKQAKWRWETWRKSPIECAQCDRFIYNGSRISTDGIVVVHMDCERSYKRGRVHPMTGGQ